MRKSFLYLIILGVIMIVAMIAWQLYLTVSGANSNVIYSITPIDNTLYAGLDKHLTTGGTSSATSSAN